MPLQIVHRDVSPSNVLCSYNGEVKLCDFGIAKATLTRVQTKTGVIKGKVKYMSPEQAMGRKLDRRSDLFSLGTVMYEMLTLQAPFQAPTEVELIFAVRDAQETDASSIMPPTSPTSSTRSSNRLMTRSRSQRYQIGRRSGARAARVSRALQARLQPQPLRPLHAQQFAEEIERELRLLEEYVIDSADPSKVGENLIADALGDDAPYTQFTAASTAYGTRVGSKSSRLKKRGDLHAEPTRIFDPDASRLHGLETRILDTNRPRPPRDFDEQTTGSRSRERQTVDTPPTADTPSELPALSTRMLDRDLKNPKLHDAKTQIIRAPEGRRRRDTIPEPPRRTVTKKPADDFDEDEETSLPLSDDDLIES